MERPNAFIVGCVGTNAGKLDDIGPPDAFAEEIAVIFAGIITAEAFFGCVCANFGAAIGHRDFAVDARETAVSVAMRRKRRPNAIVADGDFSGVGCFCVEARSVGRADFAGAARARHALAFDACLRIVGACFRFAARGRNGRRANAVMADEIAGARARHGTRRFGDAFFVVARITAAAVAVGVTNDFVARNARQILAKQAVIARIDDRTRAVETGAVFAADFAVGARTFGACIFGTDDAAPVQTCAQIVAARAIGVAFGDAFPRYADFCAVGARFCRRAFVNAAPVFANLAAVARRGVGAFGIGATPVFANLAAVARRGVGAFGIGATPVFANLAAVARRGVGAFGIGAIAVFANLAAGARRRIGAFGRIAPIVAADFAFVGAGRGVGALGIDALPV